MRKSHAILVTNLYILQLQNRNEMLIDLTASAVKSWSRAASVTCLRS